MMLPAALDSFLMAHGSALILPLAVIEGPLVAIATGFLTAAGYFDWYWALPLLVAGDLVGDLMYYWIGRSGRTPLAGVLRWLGVRATVSPDLQHRLATNSTKMLFIGKWTHTIGLVVLVGSGMLRLPQLRFLMINLIATLPKIAVLFAVGYFAGGYYRLVEEHVVLSGIVLGIAGVAALLLVWWRADSIRANGTGR